MSDIKMSDEDVSYVLQYLSGFEPEDIECDDFDIAVNDDQFANFSIVRAAKLGHEVIDRLTEENAQLKADKAELVKALEMAMDKLDSASFQLISNPNHSTWEMGQLMALMAELLQKHKEPNNA